MAHPPALREQAAKLRNEEKLLMREIAERLGVPKPTVVRWLNPELEQRERVNARARKLSRRCPSCKSKMSADARLCVECHKRKQLAERPWPREKVIEAIQAWAAKYGYAPVYNDWDASGPGHPARASILDGPNPVFPNWSAALRAAGFTPRKRRKARAERIARLRRAIEKENRVRSQTEVQ